MDYIIDDEAGLSVRNKLNTLVDQYNFDTVPETSTLTIYVETTGDDDTGDGTVGSPFATIKRAIQSLPQVILDVDVTIQLGSGTFDWDADCRNEFSKRLFIRSDFIIFGAYSTYLSSVTTVETATPMTYTMTGTFTVTEDELTEKWIYDGNKNNPLLPIGYNSAGTNSCTLQYPYANRDKSGVDIVTLSTTINLDDERALNVDPLSHSTGAFYFKCVKFAEYVRLDYTTYPKSFNSCNFEPATATATFLLGSYGLYTVATVKFHACMFLNSQTAGYAFNFARFFGVADFRRCFFYSKALTAIAQATMSLDVFEFSGIVFEDIIFRGNGAVGTNRCFKVQRVPTISHRHNLAFRDYHSLFTYEGDYKAASLKWFGLNASDHTYLASQDWSMIELIDVDYIFDGKVEGTELSFQELVITSGTNRLYDTGFAPVKSVDERIHISCPDFLDEENSARTIYVASTGNDSTGDGSSGNEYATLLRALQDIRSVINDVTITISVGAGTFSWSNQVIEKELGKKQFLGGAILLIEGTPVLKDSGFTLSASADPYIYNVSGKTFTANEHQDRFLLVSGNYYGIVKNGTTTLNTFVGLAAGVSIYGMDTIFQVDDADLNITAKLPNANSRIQVEQCTIDASSYALDVCDSSVEWRIRDVLIKALSLSIDQQNNKVLFNRTHLVLSSGGIDDKGDSNVSTSYKYTSVRKSGTLGGTGIKLPTSDRLFQDVYVENFLYGVYCTNGKVFGNQSGTDLILDNCTYGFEVRNGTKIIFTLLNVYIDGVDYTFSALLETLQWNVKVFIENFNGTPDVSTFHSSVDVSATDATKDIYWIIT